MTAAGRLKARHRDRGGAALLLTALLLVPATGSRAGEQAVAELEAEMLRTAAARAATAGDLDAAMEMYRSLQLHYGDSGAAPAATAALSRIRHLDPGPARLSPAARIGLLGFGTLYATGMGIGTGILMDSAEAIFGLGFIAGPTLGIVTGIRRTRGLHLSDGQASLLALGGTWGAWQGLGVAILMGAEAKGIASAGMAGSTSGLLAARALVRRRYATAKEATMASLGGIWGSWVALAGLRAAGMDGKRTMVVSTLVAGNLGLAGATRLATELNPSRARTHLVNLAGFVGTLYGLGTAVMLDVHDRARPTFGLMLVGSAAGLAAGCWLTGDYDRDRDPLSTGGSVEGSWKLAVPEFRPTPAGPRRRLTGSVDLWLSGRQRR